MKLTTNAREDPKFTAYALGELEGAERAEVEAALRDDPVARAAVEEIRALAAQLETALAQEAAGEHAAAKIAAAGAAEPANGAEAVVPAKEKGGERSDPYRRPKGGTRLRFPKLYWITTGLAAAGFAALVAVREPATRERARLQAPRIAPEPPAMLEMPKIEEEPEVAASVAPGESAQNDPAPAKEVEFSVPTSLLDQAKANGEDRRALGAAVVPGARVGGAYAPVPKTANNAVGQAGAVAVFDLAQLDKKREQRVVYQHPRDEKMLVEAQPRPTAPSVANPAEQAVVLSPFAVEAEPGEGYRASNTIAGTRINTTLHDVGNSVTTGTPEFFRDGPAGNFARQGGKDFNTEAYAYRADNEFLAAAENPLSTFSADVDTASYANVRRMLMGGSLPPPDAVRIEELLNYFPYRYAGPEKQRGEGAAAAVPFAATLEVAEAPWAPAHRLVRIGLKGREVAAAERGPANLVFLLDVSGSMSAPNKLPLVKESLRLLLGRLRADDRVAIVTYAGASGLALPSTPVAKAREIAEAIEELRPGGSTNGAMGIQLAYDIAKANLADGGVNRVILCTDGDFNVGVTSQGELVRLIQEKAKSGVFLTVLGFGMGNYKDATLQQLADAGNGNYGYIDTRREAEKLLVAQVSGTLVTIAKDVKLQVEFNPARVASHRLIGYEKRLLKKEDFNNDKVDAGEIGAGHTVTALYEIVPVGAGEKAVEAAPAVDELKYRPRTRVSASVVWEKQPDAPGSDELLTLKVRYKEPAGETSKRLEFPLRDGLARFADASADFKFAAAVAEFGMILRGSPHRGAGTMGEVVRWAEAGAGDDPGGYRAEFIALAKRADELR